MPWGTGGVPVGRLLKPLRRAFENPASEFVEGSCPDCWKAGCGLSPLCGLCADGLELVNPCLGAVANAIWILGSPLAFPIIFCFSAFPHTDESSGYEISMLQACYKRPCACCWSTLCLPCGQWYARSVVLGGDWSKYKLWQGYHDGPHCCARRCPSSPCIVIESGTYGEQNCPRTFLCLEVCCLGGFYSVCCAFDVSRRYQRDEQGLLLDPTEARQQKCIRFFSKIMHRCFQLGCCVCVCSCCVGLCAPDSNEAQDCASQGQRASRNCCRIASTIWKGITWVRVLAIGCMTAQILNEASVEWDGKTKKGRPELLLKAKQAPEAQKMDDRGDDVAEDTEHFEFHDMKMPWEEEAAAKSTAKSKANQGQQHQQQPRQAQQQKKNQKNKQKQQQRKKNKNAQRTDRGGGGGEEKEEES